MISRFSEMMQADIRVASYDRGFFSSDVVLELKLANPSTVIQFSENIIHGPVYLGLLNQGKSPLVAAVIKGKLVPNAEYRAMLNKVFAGQSPLVYQEIVDYTGNVVVDVYVPAVDTVIEQDTGPLAIQSSGMVFKSVYSMAQQTMSGEGGMAEFVFNSEQSSVSVENLKMNFSGRMGINDLLMGDSNLSLARLDVQSANEQFAMHDLRVSSVTSEVGQLINSLVQVNVREIYASNERFGPATFNIAVNGLNAGGLKKLQAMQKDIEARLEQGVPPEQINAMVAGEMIALVPDLIKQADMKIDPFKLDSELGSLQSTLNFSVEGLDQNAPADPMFMMSALNLDLTLDVDAPLMRQLIIWYLDANADQVKLAGDATARKAEKNIPLEQKVNENLQGMIDENWLTINDGVYSSHISLHQGQMQLNGKLVDPLQQFMSQMPAPGGADVATP
jgi:uncharacterized protein YdgA (DUF945 family)